MASASESSAEFGKMSDSSASKLNGELLGSSSSADNFDSDLRSIVDGTNKLLVDPCFHLYSMKSEGKKISLVDVSQDDNQIAYSLHQSHKINLVVRKCLPKSIANNDFSTAWLNYLTTRNNLTKIGKNKQEIAEYMSSSRQFIIRHDDVSGFCFSQDNNLLLSCSLNGSVKVTNTISHCASEHFEGHGSLTDIHVNNDTTRFVAANVLPSNSSHVASLYSFDRNVPVQNFCGHENSLNCVRFHPNGLYFATASTDKSIKLWDIHQYKEVRSFGDGETHAKKIIFSPDGQYIASTHGGCVKMWDISSGKMLKCLKTSNAETCILNISYNVDGSILAAGGSDKKIHIWNAVSDKSSKVAPGWNFLKSEDVGKTIFSIKWVTGYFSCVTIED